MTEPADTLVSVVLPTYNRAALLPRAIGSVLAQTYPSVELIVVDDGSTDATAEVVRSIEATSGKSIRYLTIPHGGAPRARNLGIDVAEGEYLAFQDSDDEWDPQFLETLLSAVGGSRSTIGFCSVEILHRHGVREVVPPRHVQNPASGLLRSSIVSMQSAVVPRGLLADARFDPSLRRGQDWDLWLQLLQSGGASFIHVPRVLATLHRQPDSITEGGGVALADAYLRILRKHLPLLLHSPWSLAWHALLIARGRLRAALKWVRLRGTSTDSEVLADLALGTSAAVPRRDAGRLTTPSGS